MALQEVHAREVALARSLYTSAADENLARQYLDIPDDVNGVTIVDLAAGVSSFVADLLKNGANAYAVDQLYFQSPTQINYQFLKYLDVYLKQFDRFERKKREAEVRQTYRVFSGSFQERRERYIASWLTSIALPDSFADLTTSFNGLLDLADDQELLDLSFGEAARITKVGGEMIFAPFDNDESSFTKFSVQHAQFKERIARQVQSVQVVTKTGTYTLSALHIIK